MSEWGRYGADAPERLALVALSAHLGVELRPRSLEIERGTNVEIEGVDPAGRYLVQCVLNQGAYTSQQRNKTLADLFKLQWLRDRAFPGAVIGLVLSPTTVEAFKPRSWTSIAARELGVRLFLLESGSITPLN
ncbi:hypothetical protein [Nocardioides sp. Kera G14]|uniref:hypothetical protein n=1 Tax=Nocardioides sp. Kera G14 TaxID=2884264 RepID=UPI001D0FA293|nr:hypothetical protein [Nocardioides sp. Kera G14]UDY22881.1 hypothetical protein LH076_12495 [Nocardioides sp. Kera G14]